MLGNGASYPFSGKGNKKVIAIGYRTTHISFFSSKIYVEEDVTCMHEEMEHPVKLCDSATFEGQSQVCHVDFNSTRVYLPYKAYEEMAFEMSRNMAKQEYWTLQTTFFLLLKNSFLTLTNTKIG